MLKPVIAATALLAIAGSSYVYAQQGDGGRGYGGRGDGGFRSEQRHRLSPEDRAAFADARIAALKAGLELTPDQARNWPAFEQALHDMVQLRTQLRQAREAARQQGQDQSQDQNQSQSQNPGQNQPQAQTPAPTGPFDRMARRADNLSKTSAALKRIADTGAPLYQSLNDAQKNRFTMLARLLRPHHHGMRGGNEGGWRQGQGGGRGDDRGYSGREGRGNFGRGDRDFSRDGRDAGRGGRDFGQDGRGWHHHRFGQDDRGTGGRRHDMIGSDADQGEQL